MLLSSIWHFAHRKTSALLIQKFVNVSPSNSSNRAIFVSIFNNGFWVTDRKFVFFW
jgi:hypothetical protein